MWRNFFICTMSIALLLQACPTRAANELSNIHVFIVAIGEFDDKEAYRSLTAAAARENELIEFFRETYDLPRAQIHSYSDRTNNATEKDLGDLSRDIERVAKDNRSIVFLFILSHGKVVSSPEFGQDLLVVATNTAGDANAPGAGRVLGSDFFRSFAGVGENSIVFAFFDTCSSGALSNVGNQFGSVYRLRHQRVISAASSSAGQDSYDFSFTAAILARWREIVDGCDKVSGLGDRIQLRGQGIRVLSTDDEVCLNGVSASKAMLFILPSYAAPGMVAVRDANATELTTRRFIQQTDFLPLLAVLPRTTVQVQLYDPKGRELQWLSLPLDLSRKPIAYQELGQTIREASPYAPRSRNGVFTYGMQSPIVRERSSP